nr:glycosyl hydrolase family 18 protein [Candidatus Sigynarchaeota archaeon]
GFTGDFSWLDPNPMSPGLPRSIIFRAYAPWDTFVVAALAVGTLLLLLMFMTKKTKHFAIITMLLGVGLIVAWTFMWSEGTVPMVVWAFTGFICYTGFLIGTILFAMQFFRAPSIEAASPLMRRVSFPLVARAWLVVVPLTCGSIVGLNIRGVIDRSMDYLPYIVPVTVVLVVIILLVLTITIVIKRRVIADIVDAFQISGPRGRRARNVIFGAFLLFGSIYALATTSYHDTSFDRPSILFMWGGDMSSWDPGLDPHVTHTTWASFSIDPATGNMTSTIIPSDYAAYHSRGIKVFPTIGMSGTELYYFLKNVNSTQDMFETELHRVLVESGVDGVAVDFEMMETPSGAPPAENEDWIQLWERVHGACKANGSDFLFANYWNIGASYSRSQVNRYFHAVDLHIENMYESHWWGGSQGSTTIIERSISGIMDIYALLDNKSMMAKILPGLPLYHYIWIDGVSVPLNESQIIPGGQDGWPFLEYDVLEHVLINNSAVFRWDPFSGATYARFSMTLTDNRTETCVAWLHDTAHLAMTMHVMQGYGIEGLMLWPARQQAPPGFAEAFFS